MKNKLNYLIILVLLLIFVKVSLDGYGFYNSTEENLKEHSESTFSEEELPVEFVKTITANNTKVLIYKNAEDVFVFDYIKSFFSDKYKLRYVFSHQEENEIRFMSQAPLYYNNISINTETFEALIEEVPNNTFRNSILKLIIFISISEALRRYRKKKEKES